jgi:integral membrane protein
VSGALTRFRVLAYVVGVFLLLLTVGVVLRYGFGEPTLSETVSPIHGFLYILYVIAVFDLGRRLAWSIRRMVLVMLAGTIPFLSFYAERVVRRRWRPVEPPRVAAHGGGPPARAEGPPSSH